MKTKPILVSFMSLALGVAALGGDHKRGLTDEQFEQALRNVSTGPNYVLVSIVDKSKDGARTRVVCVEGVALLTALLREHGFSHADEPWEQPTRFALTQKNRTFEFSKKAPKARYTCEMLNEVRRFLAGKNETEIRKLAGDQQSELYKLCGKKPGSFPRYFPAVGHVLCERGILCGRNCKPGLLYVNRRKATLDDAVQAVANLHVGMSHNDALQVLSQHGIQPSGAVGGTLGWCTSATFSGKSQLVLHFRFQSRDLRDRGPSKLTGWRVLNASGELLPEISVLELLGVPNANTETP